MIYASRRRGPFSKYHGYCNNISSKMTWFMEGCPRYWTHPFSRIIPCLSFQKKSMMMIMLRCISLNIRKWMNAAGALQGTAAALQIFMMVFIIMMIIVVKTTQTNFMIFLMMMMTLWFYIKSFVFSLTCWSSSSSS